MRGAPEADATTFCASGARLCWAIIRVDRALRQARVADDRSLDNVCIRVVDDERVQAGLIPGEQRLGARFIAFLYGDVQRRLLVLGTEDMHMHVSFMSRLRQGWFVLGRILSGSERGL